MKNAYTISSLADQLGKVADQIQSLAMIAQEAENNAGSVVGVFEEMLLDEVEHVQIVALELTKLIVPTEENADEGDAGVFAAGELQHENGEVETQEPDNA